MHTGKRDFWYNWQCHAFLAGNFIEGFRWKTVFVSYATLIWEQERSVMMLVSARDWCLPARLPTLVVSFPDLLAFSSSRVSSEARWERQASEHCCSLSNTCYHDIPRKTKESASKFLNWCMIADITQTRSPPASARLLMTLHSSSSYLVLAVLPHTPPIADKFCAVL